MQEKEGLAEQEADEHNKHEQFLRELELQQIKVSGSHLQLVQRIRRSVEVKRNLVQNRLWDKMVIKYHVKRLAQLRTMLNWEKFRKQGYLWKRRGDKIKRCKQRLKRVLRAAEQRERYEAIFKPEAPCPEQQQEEEEASEPYKISQKLNRTFVVPTAQKKMELPWPVKNIPSRDAVEATATKALWLVTDEKKQCHSSGRM